MRKFILLLILTAIGCNVNCQVITSAQIDSVTNLVLKTFDVPGIAVAVVKDGKVIHAKGYGVRSLRTNKKVDENTLFGIASNSKAFTTAAISMLVDEGKMKWDDKVIDYVPEFRLHDPYVTSEFTIRDLVTHRSGLGLGAGDLMIWPEGNNFTKDEIIHNLRYLKPVSSFRTKFDYDNLLYIVAGEVLRKVSGMTWEDFVESRIMQPLGMTQSASNFKRLKDSSNVIDPHAPVNGKVQVIARDLVTAADPAGGIYSNLADLSKWIIMQMNGGKYGKDLSNTLFSPEMQQQMWSIQTVIPVNTAPPYNTHFGGYGLGWFLNDMKGYKQASHTGGLAGIVTQITLIPEMKLGIIVLTNQQSGAAFNAITSTIRDSYFGITGMNRVKQNKDAVDEQQKEASSITDAIWKDINEQRAKNKSVDLKPYLGTFSDPWFGKITIAEKNGVVRFDSERSPRLTGELLYYRANTFVAKWDDRSMDADAYVEFSLDNTGNAVGIHMKPISPLTDFSYDFQDLDFTRTPEK